MPKKSAAAVESADERDERHEDQSEAEHTDDGTQSSDTGTKVKKAKKTKKAVSKPTVSTSRSKRNGTASSEKKPPFLQMVKEAIMENSDTAHDVRVGISRQAIKKFIIERYGETDESKVAHHVAKAIKSGQDKGDLELPKGPSGSVKLSKNILQSMRKSMQTVSSSTRPSPTSPKPKKKLPVVKPAPQAVPEKASRKTATNKAAPNKKRKREVDTKSSGDESSGVENTRPAKKSKPVISKAKAPAKGGRSKAKAS